MTEIKRIIIITLIGLLTVSGAVYSTNGQEDDGWKSEEVVISEICL